MGKFLSMLVDSNNRLIYFDKDKRDLILKRELKDKHGNLIYDADSHSSIASFYFSNPYEEDAYNKIEFNPYNNKIECKSMVFKLNENEIVDSISKNIDITALNNELDFSVKPFKFKNFSKDEVNNFLIKNKNKVVKTLKRFKNIEASVPAYFDSTMINGVWSKKSFDLVHDSILVPSRIEMESNLVGDNIKINNAYAYSLRNFLMLSVMARCFKNLMIDTQKNKIETEDFYFLAQNHFVIACDGREYKLFANVEGEVIPILTLEDKDN